ncbi:MAG TPA: hypothetical protein VFN13_02585 [Rudaea sp.]|nr:hypothetical protein [Rudaea sp.]
MNEEISSLRDMIGGAPTVADLPSPDLWSRIAVAHAQRVRRRRNVRIAGAALVSVFGICALLMLSSWHGLTQDATASVDWQARAQALELQLDGLPMPYLSQSPSAMRTVSEISRIDSSLQAAYDGGASRDSILPLWKRRSQLLSALLAERLQQPVMTDI